MLLDALNKGAKEGDRTAQLQPHTPAGLASTPVVTQRYIDMAAKNGQIDDLLSLTLEINRLPEGKVDTQCAHLHFDGDNLAVSIYKQGDAYILRPETDVTIKQTRLPNGEYGYILE